MVVEREPLDCADLMDYLRLHLPRHEVPSYIDIVEHIPKTPTKKNQRFKLAAHTPRVVDTKTLRP